MPVPEILVELRCSEVSEGVKLADILLDTERMNGVSKKYPILKDKRVFQLLRVFAHKHDAIKYGLLPQLCALSNEFRKALPETSVLLNPLKIADDALEHLRTAVQADIVKLGVGAQ